VISKQRTITQSKLKGTIERSNSNTWLTIPYQGTTTRKARLTPAATHYLPSTTQPIDLGYKLIKATKWDQI